MVGIFIGIAAVVGLISLGQGLQSAVTAQFATLSTDKLTIQNAGTGFGPPGSTSIEKLNEHDLKVIKGVRGVEYVIPRLVRMIKIDYNNIGQFKYIGDIPDDSELADVVYESIGLDAKEGRLLKSGDSGKVVIGSNIAKKEEFGKAIEVGKNINIQGKNFQVIGILKKGSSFQVNDIVMMLSSDMKDLLDIDDEIDMIIAQVEEPKEIKEVGDRIEKEMRKDRNLDLGEEDFSVQTPLEAISAVNSVLTSINVVVVGIAMISLIVGGIGIANTMYTSVLERRREIGTMKAVGAKNSDVLFIFLIESGLLGLVGGLIGVAIGLGMALGVASGANNYFGLEIITISLSNTLSIFGMEITLLNIIFLSIIFSFFIGILFGVIPSYQASKLKPVDALRM